MAPPVLYYVRHGETDWNAERRLQGQHDIPLNARGRTQAAQSGEILLDLFARDKRIAGDLDYVASPLGRARETMELMRAKLGLVPGEYRTDPRLLEMSFGRWEGFTFAELQTVTSLGRGEIRECVNRGIISAPAGVGQGNHRAYSKWNLVEGAIAAALLRHLRAGSVAHGMMKLRSMLEHSHIDPEDYCKAPGTFYFSDFKLIFPPRSEPDDKAGLPLGEEMGEGAYLLGTASATRVPYYGPPLTRGHPIAAFCKLSIDLEQAVRFVNYMIETRL